MDSSKYQPFDQAVLRQKGKQGDIFPPGDGVCMMRFYYKMWGSLHMGRLQLFMVTKGQDAFSSKSVLWQTRGKGIHSCLNFFFNDSYLVDSIFNFNLFSD